MRSSFGTPRHRSRRALPALTAVFAMVVVACGGDDGSPGASPQEDDVVVTAIDIGFAEDGYEVGAGATSIFYANEGALHTLLVEDAGGETLGADGVPGSEAFKLSVTTGTTDTGTITLEPGEYTVYCDISGHRSAGMEAPLIVT